MTAPTARPAIGMGFPRVEGRDKVTGWAKYAADYAVGEVAYVWPVPSTIAKGTVRSVDTDDAHTCSGVLAVLGQANAPHLRPVGDRELLLFQSNDVNHRGQFVAAVVADSLETARAAADQIRIEYAQAAHECEFTARHAIRRKPEVADDGFEADTDRGDFGGAFATARFRIDQTYSTPAMQAYAMEPHATTAVWHGDRLTVYDSNQGGAPVQAALAGLFGLAPEAVTVVAEHVGGGFGAKAKPCPNVVLAAMAARVVNRPVRFALARQHQFAVAGYRTPTIQRVQLGADSHGRLLAVGHDATSQTSTIRDYTERTALATRMMYAAEARRTTHRIVHLDVPSPSWMRAPGMCPGMFALESAIDELADLCGMDPIELRILNDPHIHPECGQPFSSRNLVACLRRGADLFGWADERRRGGIRSGRWASGVGVAASTYPAYVDPAHASVRLDPTGRYCVGINATDIGTGARTALRQVAADALGVDCELIDIRIGDSSLPVAEIAGGSAGMASWGWAVHKAGRLLRERICQAARDGISGEGLEVTAETSDDIAARHSYSRHAFGAQFVRVRVDTDTGEVRVPRMLGIFAAGRIVNPRMARSQLVGGMTMGLSMALLEEGRLDPRFGEYVNYDLASYQLAACADVEEIDVVTIDEDDPNLNPVGGKGVGEIGIVGTAAAIANAVHHATGVRIRNLPIRLDKLLTASSSMFRQTGHERQSVHVDT